MDAVGGASKSKAEAVFDSFLYTDQSLVEALEKFEEVKRCLQLEQTPPSQIFSSLKNSFSSWKITSFFEILQRRINVKDYASSVPLCKGTNMFIVGAGPCGLRCAIEAALCGITVTVVEKRSEFTRNNVLHLWPYLIHDLRNLAIKKLYGKFCAGSLDHISIRRLQLILLKICLVLGVTVHVNTSYVEYLEPCASTGWRISVKPSNQAIESTDYHVLVGADGKRNSIPGFQRKEFRAKLAIGITANFVNRNTDEEAKIEEISGVAALFNQKFFADLKLETDIDLENIVYYKDDTHYFVMTAKKSCLLKKGVLKQDNSEVIKLLAYNNVDRDQLLNFTRQAADFSAGLPHYQFAVDPVTGKEDVAIFDFTSMYSAEYAARVLEKRGQRLLVGLVGDGLMEPFWPLGTGCARGFLSCMDLVWTFRRLRSGVEPCEVLAERMALYQILHQTSNENMNKSHAAYTLDPKTRYKLIPKFSEDVSYLYEHVDKENNKKARRVEEPAVEAEPQRKKLAGETTDTIHKEFKDKTFARTRRPKRPSILPLIAPQKKRSLSPSHRKQEVGKEPITDQESLLRWCQEKLKPILPFLPVTDLDTCWRDGVLLCGLVHLCSPADINMGEVKNQNTDKENVDLAITVMSNELGVDCLAAQDILPPNGPDLLAIITTIVELKKILEETVPVVKNVVKNGSAGPAKKKATIAPEAPTRPAAVAPPSTTTAAATPRDQPTASPAKPKMETATGALKRRVHSQRKLRKKTESKFIEQVDTSTVLPAATTNTPKKGSQKCHGCAQSVLVIKRVTIEGYVFHRKCFKCEECETPLKSSTYHLITPPGASNDPGRFYCKTHFNQIVSKSRELKGLGSVSSTGSDKKKKKEKKPSRPTSVFAKVSTAKQQQPASSVPNLPDRLPEESRYTDTALAIHAESKDAKRTREPSRKEEASRTREPSKKREVVIEELPAKPKRSKSGGGVGDNTVLQGGPRSNSPKLKGTVQVTRVGAKGRAQIRTPTPPPSPGPPPSASFTTSSSSRYMDVLPTEGLAASKPVLAVPAGNANVTVRKKSQKSYRAPEPPARASEKSTPPSLISRHAADLSPAGKRKNLPIAAGVKGKLLPSRPPPPDQTPHEMTPDTSSISSRDSRSQSRDSRSQSRDTERGGDSSSSNWAEGSGGSERAAKPQNRVMAVRRFHNRASSVTDLDDYLPMTKKKLTLKYKQEAKEEEDRPVSVKDRIAQYSTSPGRSTSSASAPVGERPSERAKQPLKRLAVGPALKSTVSRDKKIINSSRSAVETDGGFKRATTVRRRRPRLKPNHRRLVQAQTIQRDRSILEQKMTEFEQQAAEIEQQLRTAENTHDDALLSQFLEVVNIKNNLTRRENELHLCEKYLQLLDEQDQLEAELRYTMDLPETVKTFDLKMEEEELILKKFDVVNRRDYLLTQLHESKKREEEEDELIQEMLSSKGIKSNKYGYTTDCFLTIEDLLEAETEDSGYNDETEEEPAVLVNLRKKEPSEENTISKFFNRLSIFS